MRDAFISYSRKDADFARRLEKALEAYRPPKDLAVAQRHLDVFRDEGDLTGVEYSASIERALADSARLIVICSPNARGSRYVDDEIERFVKLRGPDSVVPVLLAGIPNNEARTPDDPGQAFPAALCKALAMPLAVPYRGFDAQKDRVDRGAFADAWFVLLANLYGVSRDELEQREKRRRARQLRIVVGIVSGIFVALAAALAVSIVFWRQAVEQKNIAVTQSHIALSRQLSANSAQYADADPRLAALLAVEAWATQPTPEARRALYGAMQMPIPFTLLDSKQAVQATAFSPNGRLLAAGGKDAMIHLWDVATHRPRGEPWPVPHPGSYPPAINGLAFSPDGKTLASVGDDSKLHLWDVASGKPLGDPLPATEAGGVYSVAFSPDGKMIATGNGLKEVILWDAARQVPIRKLEGHGFAVNALAFAPNGELLAASSGNDVQLWKPATGEKAAPPLKGHTSLVWSLAFSPQGDQLASGSEDSTIRLWRMPEGESEGEPLVGNNNWVKALAYSPLGRLLISGSNDQTIRFWDSLSRRQLGTPLEGHRLWVESVAVDRSGYLLSSAGGDGALILWSLARDGVRFKAGEPIHDEELNSTFSADGQLVGLSEYGKGAQVWDIDSHEVIAKTARLEMAAIASALSNDGRLYASSDVSGITLSDVRADRKRCVIPAEDNEAQAIEFSPDGTLLAGSLGADSFGIWNTSDCTRVKLPPVKHERPVWKIAFTADGRHVVTGDFKSVHVQELAGGASRVIETAGDAGVFGLSRDSRVIAVSNGIAIELHDLQTGRLLGALAAQRGAVRDMSLRMITFSADGKLLAGGGDSQTLTIWDIASARPLGPPIDPALGQLRYLAFTPDGRRLVLSGTDGPITMLDMDVDSWMREVCSVARGELTADEWRRFVGSGVQVPRCKAL